MVGEWLNLVVQGFLTGPSAKRALALVPLHGVVVNRADDSGLLLAVDNALRGAINVPLEDLFLRTGIVLGDELLGAHIRIAKAPRLVVDRAQEWRTICIRN